MPVAKNFLITGASSGFGQAIARAAIAEGHRVIGTVRRDGDREALEALHPDLARAAILDVTSFGMIDGIVGDIQKQYGLIDVLINSAGYGHEGVIEESPLEEMRHQLDVNLFGAVAMMKAVLPFMRERRRGHIINITSMAGCIAFAGIGYYTASKYALEGVSEVLAKEVAPFGIRVTAIAPGSFRTDWAGRSMIRSERRISDYDALFEPIRKARQEKSGKQNGDPNRAAQVVMDLVAMDHPPVHLLLGSDALSLVEPIIKARLEQIKSWEAVSRSTDYR
ncbi:Short-chain dehydrogenase [Rhizobiales bacterium GAS113]|nr:Short-chain dehydrogenase [Rhizobiales bacterium GAS113]